MNFVRIIALIVFCMITSFSSAQNMVVDVPSSEIVEESASPSSVTVDIHMVQVLLNDEHRQGVDWEAIVSDFHTLQLKKEDNPVWADKKYKVSVGTVSKEDYVVLLDALDTVGKMVQLPQGSVKLGFDVKQSTPLTLADAASANVRLDQLLIEEKGVLKLQVTPYVDVLLKETGEAVSTVLRAKTDVALKEDMTIVIGGLISEHEITKVHKFPLLGSLPLVGLVFRSHGRLVQRTETIVFITPHFKSVEEKE